MGIINPAETLSIPDEIYYSLSIVQRAAIAGYWARLISYKSVNFVAYSQSQTLYLEAITHEGDRKPGIGECYSIAITTNGNISTTRLG